MLSAALVFGKRDHMAMTFVYDKMSQSTKRVLSIINEVFVLIFAIVVLIYGGISITSLTATQLTASFGVPMSYIYVIVPLSGFITALYAVLNIVEILKEGE